MFDLSPFSDFDSAAMETLRFLREKTGFDLCMATRRQDNEWLVLQVEAEGYSVLRGDVFNWDDSMCYRMVKGQGPTIAHDVSKVSAYQEAPIASKLTIGAYLGVPLTNSDGSLFGTLCGINRTPVGSEVENHTDLLNLLGRLLSTVLNNDIKMVDQERMTERFQRDATTDSLTGLKNRRGWEDLIAIEESRSRRHGHSACIVVIDIDGLKKVNDLHGHAAGDQLLRDASLALSHALREQDVAARVGGDEFAVLGVECQKEGAAELEARIREVMANVGIEASVGLAMREPKLGLSEAWKEADKAMYLAKRSKRYNQV